VLDVFQQPPAKHLLPPNQFTRRKPPHRTSTAKMPGVGIRALARDVFFYDRRNPSTLLGGLVRTNGITKTNFYFMIDIVLVISTCYLIQDDDGTNLPRDSEPLPPGNYFIVADGTVEINDKIALLRMESLQTGTRVRESTEMVRERDRRCVITKRKNAAARFELWDSFEAAHIFPLAYEGYWNQYNFGRWITLPESRGGLINSVQNGMLLERSLHTPFDTFNISINPDVSILYFCLESSSYYHPRVTIRLSVSNQIRITSPAHS
jgi:hypothetical protein